MKVQTYLPLFSGFYGSHWDNIDFYGEDEYYALPEGDDFYDYIDWAAYHNKIANEMCYEVYLLYSEYVSDIEFEDIRSPKYYNFENDSINCTIDINQNKVQIFLRDNLPAFGEYLRERYTSRDGFNSFYSNQIEDWIFDWHQDSHKAGSVLEFIGQCQGYEEPWDLNDCHYSLFYKQEIEQFKID